MDVVCLGHVIDASDPVRSRWTTPHLCLLSAEELRHEWSGADVSRAFIEELRSAAHVHEDVQAQADWFWEILISLDDATRAKYFRFVTGGSRRPCGGAVELDFRIGPKEGGDGAYPFAHACANTLDMPRYSSLSILRDRLEAAVETAHDKFTDL